MTKKKMGGIDKDFKTPTKEVAQQFPNTKIKVLKRTKSGTIKEALVKSGTSKPVKVTLSKKDEVVIQAKVFKRLIGAMLRRKKR